MKSYIEKASLPVQGLSPHFIGAWTLYPPSICEDLIDYFESHNEKQSEGVITGGQNTDIKNSTDIKISPNEIKLAGNEVFDKYFHLLFSCYEEYVTSWPFLKSFAENLFIGDFNLQRYRSGQHFQRTHTERSSLETLHRLFAWMTYLNDVEIEDGGSTFFSHYELNIQPSKGLTLIWPAEWTHAHKGNLLVANTKYIITGWMHFPHYSNSPDV